MASSSNLPPVTPAPSATAARRSSRLHAKKLTDEPQASKRSTHVPTTQVANKKPKNDHTASISKDSDAAARFVAVDCLLRLQYTDANHLKFGSLPPPPASVGLISTPGITTQQPDKSRGEKENEATPLPRSITDATHLATNATTTAPSVHQPLKPKQTVVATTKRTRDSILKRKADNDVSEVNGPVLQTQKAEICSFKRPRNKFIAEPSERVTRSLNVKVEVEGASVDKVILQKHESRAASTEPAMASTSADNSTVNSNAELLACTIGSVARPEAFDDKLELQNLASTSASAQRPRLTLVIPGRARSATVESAATTVDLTSPVESAVAVTEPEVELKAQKFAEQEPSAAPKIRVPGGKCINAAA